MMRTDGEGRAEAERLVKETIALIWVLCDAWPCAHGAVVMDAVRSSIWMYSEGRAGADRIW